MITYETLRNVYRMDLVSTACTNVNFCSKNPKKGGKEMANVWGSKWI